MIAESFFLNFESVDKKKNTLKLLAWAHIQSIANIKKSKDDDKTLVFTWHDQTKKAPWFTFSHLLGRVLTKRFPCRRSQATRGHDRQNGQPLRHKGQQDYQKGKGPQNRRRHCEKLRGYEH